MWEPNQFKEYAPQPRCPISLKMLIGCLVPFLFAILAILPRLSLPLYNGKYLWAEDGVIYINQAKSLLFSSLWKPYAGYLQVYPRLIALVGSMFPLKEMPAIYICGWFLAVIIAIYAIKSGFELLGHSKSGIALAIVAVLLQPNMGDIFFNNVNTQWFIGLALAVYLIVPGSPSQTLVGVLGAFIASISGPFSIIYYPIIFYKIFFEKKLRKYWLVYGATLLGGLIQTFYLLISPRVSFLHDFNYSEAIKIFFGIFAFGAHGFWLAGVAVFWITFCYFFITSKRKERTVASLFLLTGVGVWLASIYASNSDLSYLASVVFGTGNRYTFIPYATFILAYIAACRATSIGYLIISGCLLPFFCSQVMPVSYSLGTVNTEFDSYVDFAHHANYIKIPTNPMWSTYPGWHITGELFFHGNQQSDPDHITFNDAGILSKNGSFQIPVPSRWCAKSNYVGIESVLYHERAGWIETEANNLIGKNKSLKRYYPAGYVTTQFAFPYGNYTTISMTLQGQRVEKSNIKSISIYCPDLRVVIENNKFSPEADLVLPVTLKDNANTPLPLLNGQHAQSLFVVPENIINNRFQVTSVSVSQGNYGNTADGSLEVTLCHRKVCSKGSRPISQSLDNSFFTIPLAHPLPISPGDKVELVVTHVGGNKPDALWVWPEKAGYPQELAGPQGPMPGKAIRIALKYQPQKQK
jgi:hypothetical protein